MIMENFPGGENWYPAPNIRIALPNTALKIIPMTHDGLDVEDDYPFVITSAASPGGTPTFEQVLTASGATFPAAAVGMLCRVTCGSTLRENTYGERGLIKRVTTRTSDTALKVDDFPVATVEGDQMLLMRRLTLCHKALIWVTGTGANCYIGFDKRPLSDSATAPSAYIDTSLMVPFESPGGFNYIKVVTTDNQSANYINILAW